MKGRTSGTADHYTGERKSWGPNQHWFQHNLCNMQIDFYFPIEIDLETEEAEYNAYMFYQLLEEQTSHSYTLVEDVKVTPELAKIIANLWRDKGLQEAFRYS